MFVLRSTLEEKEREINYLVIDVEHQKNLVEIYKNQTIALENKAQFFLDEYRKQNDEFKVLALKAASEGVAGSKLNADQLISSAQKIYDWLKKGE